MQKLTLKGVKAAARKAYEAGKLMAQYPSKQNRFCVYSNGEYGCAVGVALNKSTHKAIAKYDEQNGAQMNGSGVDALLEWKLVAIANDDMGSIKNIQVLHDMWAGKARIEGAKAAATVAARKAFLEAIAA